MKWTKVTQKMPELTKTGEPDFEYQTSGKLLLFDKDSGIIIGMFEKGGGDGSGVLWENWRIDDENDVYVLEAVTHWMPLPNPPDN
jgi:hypothetical protein